MSGDRSLWDEEGWDEAMAEMQEEARREAEQDWADRWLNAWDRLVDLGVVSDPEDRGMTLAELERLTSYAPEPPS